MMDFRLHFIIVLYLFFPSFIGFTLVNAIDQVNPSLIIDSKTGKELILSTQTYYAIQNQQTLRYLIWFGKNGTVDTDLEQNQGKYWHVFEKLKGNWYKMHHHFGYHTVKIAKSHDEAFYHIFNKDCNKGDSPNGDYRGTIRCILLEKGNMLELNWRFIKKLEQKEDHPKKGHSYSKYVIILVGLAFVVVLGCGCSALAYRDIFSFRSLKMSRTSTQIFYSEDNQGFNNNTPVNPPISIA